MNLNNLAGCVLATSATLPPIQHAYEYIVAANGLFIRAEDSRMEAMVPIFQIDPARMNGLAMVEPYARLKAPKIGPHWIERIEGLSVHFLPDEVMMQFIYVDVFGVWDMQFPSQTTSPASVHFKDNGESVIDVHSHGIMEAFFSTVDDADERGLRFYCVVGCIHSTTPQISCRVGVYGHHMNVPASTIFEDISPFYDTFGVETNADIPF